MNGSPIILVNEFLLLLFKTKRISVVKSSFTLIIINWRYPRSKDDSFDNFMGNLILMLKSVIIISTELYSKKVFQYCSRADSCSSGFHDSTCGLRRLIMRQLAATTINTQAENPIWLGYFSIMKGVGG